MSCGLVEHGRRGGKVVTTDGQAGRKRPVESRLKLPLSLQLTWSLSLGTWLTDLILKNSLRDPEKSSWPYLLHQAPPAGQRPNDDE